MSDKTLAAMASDLDALVTDIEGAASALGGLNSEEVPHEVGPGRAWLAGNIEALVYRLRELTDSIFEAANSPPLPLEAKNAQPAREVKPAGEVKPATVTTEILYGFLAPLMRQERTFLSEQVPYLQCEVARIWKRTAYLDAAMTALDASFGREDTEDGEED